MDIGVISVRYARALLKSAMDAKIEDAVYTEMQQLAKSYVEVQTRLSANPDRQAYSHCASDGKSNASPVRAFTMPMIESGLGPSG